VEVTFELEDGKFYTPKYSPSDLDGQMISFKTGLALSLNQIRLGFKAILASAV
jgi:hypothetical protein